MLTKFETKSSRVKGLAFHPKRPWILASLHMGAIQLWDYRMGTLIDKFEEHEGPVRGIHFHHTQPLFVSGGDDYRIKVWNYKLRRCLFTLVGHLDYIRTVFFHHEYPWIVSASDDQTIRIWNWQSRTCVAVLTGHNHYVMCAQFHPKEDLVVSASLDQQVRVWDISQLRKKQVQIPGEQQQASADLFGGGDAIVKYVLEGHDRGVNWASFHPTLPLIITGADDRMVKLWRIQESKAWELETLRGHVNNVSCVMFNSRYSQDIIISNSEDKTIRVWDMSKRQPVQTIRRESDRFWILAAHPEVNLLAAGHDSGMLVFKLDRERPLYTVHNNTVYYVKDRFIRQYDIGTDKDSPLFSISRAPNGSPQNQYRALSYNFAENCLLISSEVGTGQYELFQVGNDGGSDSIRGTGSSAVFVARNRMAVLDKEGSSHIIVRNLQNEITKKVPVPIPGTEAIFYAGLGNILCKADDKVVLYDLQQRLSLAELSIPQVKYVTWSQDMNFVALLCKHAIVIADRKFTSHHTIHETMRVKSAVWDGQGVLIYCTVNHIKYCLPNGDSGIVKTLQQPVYIVSIVGQTVYCLDRQCKLQQIQIDPTEYKFKLALIKGQTDTVMHAIQHGALVGQSVISYVQQKGFPAIALHLVQDSALRFSLALECGDLEVALEAATALDEKDTWYRLGVEALRQGNFQIVEYSYQKTKSWERLSFLYLITGDLDKLAKMLKIAERRGDIMSQFQNAMYLGDISQRLSILEASSQLPLAYALAKRHGLEEDAARIAEQLEELPELPQEDGQLMQAPAVLDHDTNWPLLFDAKQDDQNVITAQPGLITDNTMDESDAAEAAREWGEPAQVEQAVEQEDDAFADADYEDEDGGWGMEELEGLPTAQAAASNIVPSGDFVTPSAGVPPTQKWLSRCKLAGEQVAAGAFDAAMRTLSRQIGAVQFEPLEDVFMQVHMGAQAYNACVSGVGAVGQYLEGAWEASNNAPELGSPSVVFTLDGLKSCIASGHKLMTEGKFSATLDVMNRALLMIPLLVVSTAAQGDAVRELLVTAREYHIASKCVLQQREATEPKRQMELVAYFTHCSIFPEHLQLGLRQAMTTYWKHKNLHTCATFARRLLEMEGTPQQVSTKARSVLAECEKNPQDSVPVDYDPHNPFDICALSYTPIPRGTQYASCPYTGARFHMTYAGQISPLGNISKIGQEASGLVSSTG